LRRRSEAGVNGCVHGASKSAKPTACIRHVPPGWHIEPVRKILTWHMMKQILLQREAAG